MEFLWGLFDNSAVSLFLPVVRVVCFVTEPPSNSQLHDWVWIKNMIEVGAGMTIGVPSVQY